MGYLTFGFGWPGNLFALTLTAFLATTIGGWWIYRAGLSRATSSAEDGVVAWAWPVFGLAALAMVADLTTFGTLVAIDHDALARARALRAEATQLMLASLPPAPAPDADAAPLYERACAAIAADEAFAAEKSPLADPLAADVAAQDVAAILARHAATLELVRRAAASRGREGRGQRRRRAAARALNLPAMPNAERQLRSARGRPNDPRGDRHAASPGFRRGLLERMARTTPRGGRPPNAIVAPAAPA